MNAYRAKPLTFPWPALLYGVATLAALVLGDIPPSRWHMDIAGFPGSSAAY